MIIKERIVSRYTVEDCICADCFYCEEKVEEISSLQSQLSSTQKKLDEAIEIIELCAKDVQCYYEAKEFLQKLETNSNDGGENE